MNELQQTEFEILKHFDRICTQLELPYFLVCGSALGAVKYGGFIPWDDDIDVAMYREDYAVFLEKAPGLLPGHLFLQNYRSEPAFPQIYSKLRNSNTTYIENSAAALPINHGVFIDIFPLDGYPNSPIQQKCLEFRKRVYCSMLLSAYEIPRKGFSELLYRLFRLLQIHRHTDKIVQRFEQLISAYPVAESNLICNHGNWQGKLEYAPAWHYGKQAAGIFEGLPVPVPEHYHAYLTQKYGDYTQDLPEEERVGHHYYTVCDCKRSYNSYSVERRISI